MQWVQCAVQNGCHTGLRQDGCTCTTVHCGSSGLVASPICVKRRCPPHVAKNVNETFALFGNMVGLSMVHVVQELVPTMSSCQKLVPTMFSCQKLFPTMFSCQKLVPTMFSCQKLFPTMFSCQKLFPTMFSCQKLFPTMFSCQKLFPTMFSCQLLVRVPAMGWCHGAITQFASRDAGDQIIQKKRESNARVVWNMICFRMVPALFSCQI